MDSINSARSEAAPSAPSFSSPAAMACRCSAASTRKVARSWRMKSSCLGMARSECVSGNQLLEPLTEFVDVARRSFQLPRAGHVLRAGLLDVLHRARHLVHAHELLLARRRDLRRGLRGLGDIPRQGLDGFSGEAGLTRTGF